MSDIKEFKTNEMQEIIDFYHLIEDYGHIFELDPKLLDAPFAKIMEGIAEVKDMLNESWDM